jgi:hypothetical protein
MDPLISYCTVDQSDHLLVCFILSALGRFHDNKHAVLRAKTPENTAQSCFSNYIELLSAHIVHSLVRPYID